MKWLIIIPAVILIFITAISIYLQPNDFVSCEAKPTNNSDCKAADAIVVVSGGDTIARTQAGIDLYKNGWAKALIFSGAARDAEGPSNAAAMKQYAIGNDVPERAIFTEEQAVNTQQNAANTQSVVKEKGFTSVILVTSGYHQRRALLEFEKRAEGVQVKSHPVLEDKDWSWHWWITPRGWWLAGGELVKIAGFYAGVTEE